MLRRQWPKVTVLVPAALVISDSAVAKHINAIFTKLDLTGPRATTTAA